ncbi:MAG: efflux RND transporter periplasmic adaptor subunit [Verrucomicrobiota bacterium]
MKPLFRNTLNALLFSVLAVVPCGCSNDHKDSPPSANADTEKAEAKVVAKAGVCKHGAPDADCFICHPELREKGRLWCKEHNRYEDRCWECHPDAQDKSRLYCKEHSLYEDECFLCHPELKKNSAPTETKPGASSDSEAKPATKALMCKEHGVPENECGICHPDLLNQKQPGQGLKVRLPSAESAGKAGVVVSTPGVDTMTQGIEAFAELTFNQNKLAQITPLVGGIVKSVEVDLGNRVKQGDLLARVTSVAIGEAQSAYVKALAEDRLRDKTLERERNLRTQRISSEKDLQEAEAAHQSAMAAVQQAQQQLMVLGFDEQQIQALVEQKGTPGVLEIRAPFAGEIVERAAVQGAMVEMGKPLFTLADTTAMWAMVNIPESLLSKVQIGQKVELTVESLPGQTFTGTLTWLSAKVDDRTRMARGRVEVSNADGKLKAQMFARARILTSSADRAVVVPQAALQNVSGTTVVFVKSSADIFEARPVQLGGKRDGRVEIVAGLKPDEQVVIAGSFALKSQFLISRLGAGCVD